MEKITYEYHPSKNLKLLTERGIGFEDIIAILESDGAMTVLDTPNSKKYPEQKIYVVNVNGYAYLVPFEKQQGKIMLKTIYPSRKLTKRYQDRLRGKVNHD